MLIVGGGCRGRTLAGQLTASGHAVRATTRTESGRAGIEATGAECWIGTPDRLATLRGALDSVTVACWMLASASGPSEQLQALHGSRLELFMTQAIDTTVRGVIYDAGAGAIPPEVLATGEGIVRSLAARNAIPLQILDVAPDERERWLTQARAAIGSLLGES